MFYPLHEQPTDRFNNLNLKVILERKELDRLINPITALHNIAIKIEHLLNKRTLVSCHLVLKIYLY